MVEELLFLNDEVCMKALKRHNLSLTSPIGVALFAMVLF
jgi:hypothetical protein